MNPCLYEQCDKLEISLYLVKSLYDGDDVQITISSHYWNLFTIEVLLWISS